MKELNLQRLVFLDENTINPLCHACDKELSGFLITQEELINYFSHENIGFLVQENLIQPSIHYKPKLIIYLCRDCCKGEKK